MQIKKHSKVKINKSGYMASFVVSESIKKIFSIDFLNIEY